MITFPFLLYKYFFLCFYRVTNQDMLILVAIRRFICKQWIHSIKQSSLNNYLMGNTDNICQTVCEQCDPVENILPHQCQLREKVQVPYSQPKIAFKSNLKETDARQKKSDSNPSIKGSASKLQAKQLPKKNKAQKEGKDRRLIDEWVKHIYDDILSYESKRASPRSAANIKSKQAVLKQKIKEKISLLDLPEEAEPITLKIVVPSQFRESLYERWSSSQYEPQKLFLTIDYDQLFRLQ